jgi:voltage-gated potassium channel
VRPFVNLRSLHSGLIRAAPEPEVQSVLLIALTLILTATIVFWLVEGWSLLDSFYFSVVTIATVGYGDLAPKTVLGKIFTVAYVFCGIGIFLVAVTAFAQAALRDRPPSA